MAEPRLVVLNLKNEKIAWSKFSVLWSANGKERLGSFSESEIFDNQSNVVATVHNDNVLDSNGSILGCIDEETVLSKSFRIPTYNIIISGVVLGKVRSSKALACASVILLNDILQKS